MLRADSIAELRRVTHLIPPGKVMSYGDVGSHMVPRQTGRAVGRLLSLAAPDIVWWRVVRADGFLSTIHRSPVIAQEQEERLKAESVDVVQNSVSMTQFRALDLNGS